MRFLLKSAFWLGLIAFVLPFGQESRGTSANITWFGTLVGAEQLFEDLTGFCDRAPQACDTGREFAVFAGERIGDGVQIAYNLVQDRASGSALTMGQAPAAPSAPSAAVSSDAVAEADDRPVSPLDATDPLMTGTVAVSAKPVSPLPAPYKAPRPFAASNIVSSESSVLPVMTSARHRPAGVPTPTPAPRA